MFTYLKLALTTWGDQQNFVLFHKDKVSKNLHLETISKLSVKPWICPWEALNEVSMKWIWEAGDRYSVWNNFQQTELLSIHIEIPFAGFQAQHYELLFFQITRKIPKQTSVTQKWIETGN